MKNKFKKSFSIYNHLIYKKIILQIQNKITLI